MQESVGSVLLRSKSNIQVRKKHSETVVVSRTVLQKFKKVATKFYSVGTIAMASLTKSNVCLAWKTSALKNTIVRCKTSL